VSQFEVSRRAAQPDRTAFHSSTNDLTFPAPGPIAPTQIQILPKLVDRLRIKFKQTLTSRTNTMHVRARSSTRRCFVIACRVSFEPPADCASVN